jgi:oligopeptide transport system ATP-binding protein
MTATSVPDQDTLLEVRDLQVHYTTRSRANRARELVRAVDGVSFQVGRGETFGLVGESGCGKTTTGRAILRLVEPVAGSISFQGTDLLAAGRGRLKELRRGLQAVFQDPYDSLNPRMRVSDIVGEPLTIHRLAKGGEQRRRVAELLERVGVSEEVASRRPAELSGGQRQRIGIARALAVNPSLIVCDEAVSALDVSIQAQVLNLLRRLQRDLGLSYLFIAHDLSVVRYLSDRVGVMYLGKLVEQASSDDLYAGPYHPYTLTLLRSAPNVDPDTRTTPQDSGEPASPVNPPAGCRFHPRCPFARAECTRVEPEYTEVEPGRWVACHFWQEIKQHNAGTALPKDGSGNDAGGAVDD